MKAIKENKLLLLMCLAELAIGILMITNPVSFSNLIVLVFGLVLTLFGAFLILKYIKTEPVKAAQQQYLAKGLLFALAGIFCLLHIVLFPLKSSLLSLLFGFTILLVGIEKLQITADMIRSKAKNWIFYICSAGISVICGSIILFAQWRTTVLIGMITGIALLIGAVLGFISFIINNKKEKKQEIPTPQV